jgi:hypothetical protein
MLLCWRAALPQVKNSTTRNLHRLTSAIRFIQLLFERLVSASKQEGDSADAAAALTLREAASSAYEEALAPIHTTIVRVCLCLSCCCRHVRQQEAVHTAVTWTGPLAALTCVAACEPRACWQLEAHNSAHVCVCGVPCRRVLCVQA